MRVLSLAAPPISRATLRLMAKKIRKNLGVDGEPYFPIIEVMEHPTILDAIAPGFDFLIGEEREMGENHGLTRPRAKEIWIRSDVYEGAFEGRGRDRMTMAHELGHAILHADLPMNRRMVKEVKAYEDPEWQAKAFAGELMIDMNFLNTFSSVYEACLAFGVSQDAFQTQVRAAERTGLAWNTKGGPVA